jgi:hypothetical protein
MTNQFQIGRTYSTRSICDHNCIFAFTILGRTAKTVTRSGMTLSNSRLMAAIPWPRSSVPTTSCCDVQDLPI